MVELLGFPMGPSVNACYRNLSSYGSVGRVKTLEYRNFEREVATWASRNRLSISEAKKETGLITAGIGLKVSYHFYFKPDRLVLKSNSTNPKIPVKKLKNESKRLDVSNYIKACEDQMCQLLEIDDAYFWELAASKNMSPGKEEYVHIFISTMNHPVL